MVNNVCLHCQISGDLLQTQSMHMVSFDELFGYNPINIRLDACETKKIGLKITPKHELLDGRKIEIVGIRWQVFDCMQGFHNFKNALNSLKSNSLLSPQTTLCAGIKSIATFKKDHKRIEDYIDETKSCILLCLHSFFLFVCFLGNFECLKRKIQNKKNKQKKR